MENYLSRLNPDWPAPDYTQGREFYYTAPKKTPAWTYQDKLYYVHHSGTKAELMESGLAGEHPRVLAELPPECPTDSIYANSSGIFLVGSEIFADAADHVLYAAYYDFSNSQIFYKEISFGAFIGEGVEDFYIRGTTLYFCTQHFVYFYDLLNSPANDATRLCWECNSEFLDYFRGFDRILAWDKWVFLRVCLKADVPGGKKSYWVAHDTSCSTKYQFCFNYPNDFTESGFTLDGLVAHDADANSGWYNDGDRYRNITSIDLLHGLVWETKKQKQDNGTGTDYYSYPMRIYGGGSGFWYRDETHWDEKTNTWRYENAIKEDITIAQNTSTAVNRTFKLHYFDGSQRFFVNSTWAAAFRPLVSAYSRPNKKMSQFSNFKDPMNPKDDAQFYFFMIANDILYATMADYDENARDYISSPKMWMYSLSGLEERRSDKNLAPLRATIDLGTPQKPADEPETAPGSSQDDDKPKIDFTWSSGVRHDLDTDNDTEPDVELSDYDDPEEDIFSGLDLDALDEEPAPSQGSSSQYDNLPPSVQNVMNNSALTAEQKLAAIAAQIGIPLEEETAPAPSAPARKAVARRVTPRSTAPRSTVTRQPSAPGDAKVLTSTDVKYGILTFGKKLADVPVGTPCTLYYNGNTYSCKAHNTTRGRIDGLRRMYIDNPELQEGARVTATYDDDEGKITLTLL